MSARQPKRTTVHDTAGDVVVVDPWRTEAGVGLWCESATLTKVDGRTNYTFASLTPAQARRVARALLRFADGGR